MRLNEPGGILSKRVTTGLRGLFLVSVKPGQMANSVGIEALAGADLNQNDVPENETNMAAYELYNFSGVGTRVLLLCTRDDEGFRLRTANAGIHAEIPRRQPKQIGFPESVRKGLSPNRAGLIESEF